VLYLVVVSPIRKEKKRKRNINNNLAVLPSHDNQYRDLDCEDTKT